VSTYLGQWHFVPLVHRARGFGLPENTTAAIEKALSLGFCYIETDVRTTRDGVAVLNHDLTLRTRAGAGAKVRDLTYRDLASILGKEGLDAPRLFDLLEAHPDLHLNLDLKDQGSVVSAPAAVRRAGAVDRVCITSFSDRRLRKARRLVPPGTCTGMGTREAVLFSLLASVPMLRPLARDAGKNSTVLQIPLLDDGRRLPYAKVVRLAHARGLGVHAWTVNSPRGMLAALDLGFDGVVTDRPLELRELLVQRGAWQNC
jgi:glycerophosphoryl diester phosphodiesterase